LDRGWRKGHLLDSTGGGRRLVRGKDPRWGGIHGHGGERGVGVTPTRGTLLGGKEGIARSLLGTHDKWALEQGEDFLDRNLGGKEAGPAYPNGVEDKGAGLLPQRELVEGNRHSRRLLRQRANEHAIIEKGRDKFREAHVHPHGDYKLIEGESTIPRQGAARLDSVENVQAFRPWCCKAAIAAHEANGRRPKLRESRNVVLVKRAGHERQGELVRRKAASGDRVKREKCYSGGRPYKC
jgi:hypothetical protein